MFKHLLEKLSLCFSSERNHSPSLNVNAKNGHAKTAASTGDNNTNIVSDVFNNFNIVNPPPTILATEDHTSWEELLHCFSDHATNLIVNNYTKDRRNGKELEMAFGWQKFVISKFNKIKIYQNDIRAASFISIKNKATETLKSFMDTKNCDQFKQSWLAIGEELISLRG